MDSKDKRIYGIDLVRILAVIFLLIYHMFYYTRYYSTEINGISMIIQTFIKNFCFCCVPIFMTITGFLNKKEKYDKNFFKSLFNILIIWLIYSILEIFIFQLMGKSLFPFNIKSIIYSILSFKASGYSWYIEMYIGLYLLSPIINKAYKSFDKKEKKIILYIE